MRRILMLASVALLPTYGNFHQLRRRSDQRKSLGRAMGRPRYLWHRPLSYPCPLLYTLRHTPLSPPLQACAQGDESASTRERGCREIA
jgi:hypothetical protein